MLEAVYVIDKASGIPIYHKSYSHEAVEDVLLGGFISAISNFGKDIRMGNIKSFDTESNRIVMVSTEDRLLAVLYDPRKDISLDAHSLAGILIEEFDKIYPNQNGKIPAEQVRKDEFDQTLDTILSSKKKPFFYEVIEWSKKEFGGELFIRQKQFTKNEDSLVIDIILDRGKMKKIGLLDKITNKVIGEDFSKDVVYIKVIDGLVGSGEATDFFEACRTFGRRRSEADIPSYFPSLAVIVAKKYSPTFDRIFNDYKIKDGKHILTPEAAPLIAKMINKPPKSHRCNIQCWKWDGEFPDIVFE